MFVVEGVLPHGLEVTADPLALLQSMPVFDVLVYDGVVVEDAMLLTPMVGLCRWCALNDVLPIPGLAAVNAGNDELRVLSVLSGVIVLLCGVGAERFVVGGGCGDTGGVDHEKVAAGDELFVDLARLMDGRDGKTVEDDADAEAFDQGSPPSISVPPEEPCCPPRTSASKSASPALSPPESNPLLVLGPPKVMNSLRVVAVALFAPSSWSLRVCSFSTRADVDLMSVMYA